MGLVLPESHVGLPRGRFLRCATCHRKSITEMEHLTHRCNAVRAWLIRSYRRIRPRPVPGPSEWWSRQREGK